MENICYKCRHLAKCQKSNIKITQCENFVEFHLILDLDLVELAKNAFLAMLVNAEINKNDYED